MIPINDYGMSVCFSLSFKSKIPPYRDGTGMGASFRRGLGVSVSRRNSIPDSSHFLTFDFAGGRGVQAIK